MQCRQVLKQLRIWVCVPHTSGCPGAVSYRFILRIGATSLASAGNDAVARFLGTRRSPRVQKSLSLIDSVASHIGDSASRAIGKRNTCAGEKLKVSRIAV